MKSFFVFVCLFSSQFLQAQSVHVTELKFIPTPKYYNTKDTTIIYPIIIAANPAVSRLINKNIDSIFQQFIPDEKIKTTRELVRSLISRGLTDASYEVTYNKNDILSLKIDILIEAAYPNPSELYFNFDVRTGQPIGIRDIINDSLFGKFQSRVFADKIDSLKKFKTQLEDQKTDTSAYEWAMEEVDNYCINNIDLTNYSLSPSNLKIINRCEFPHAIRSMSPDYELKYSYQFMYPYLKPRFRDRLVK